MHTFDTLNNLTQRCGLVLEAAGRQGRDRTEGKAGGEFNSVLIVANDDAALAGLLFTSLTRATASVPIVLSSDATLPAFVGAGTLVVALSATGSDAETVNALAEAAAVHAEIMVVSPSGHLTDMAEAQGYPSVTVPRPAQPGAPLHAELFFGGWGLLAASLGITPPQPSPPGRESEFAGTDAHATSRMGESATVDAKAAIAFMERQRSVFGPEANWDANPARLLTDAFRGKMAHLYGSTPIASAAATLWADRLRHAGLPAYAGDLATDSISAGWPAGPHGQLVVPKREALVLRELDDDADTRVAGMRAACGPAVIVHELSLDGRTPIERLVGAVHLAEWTSFYLMG